MKLALAEATESDVSGILALRLAVNAEMERRFGDGRWSPPISEGSVLRLFKGPRTRKSDGATLEKVLVGRSSGKIVALTGMQTRKPWGFDLRYFTRAPCAVYLHSVEVSPKHQGEGFGRQLIAAAIDAARVWPVNTVRVSAYDGVSGAGPFYEKCGFREVGRVTYRKTPLIFYEMLLVPVSEFGGTCGVCKEA